MLIRLSVTARPWRTGTRLCKRYYASSPSALYDDLVKQGKLRSDDYQRTVVAKLDTLSGQLLKYDAPDIPEPIEYSGWLDKLRGRPTSPSVPEIPSNVPKGMYLHGDVGCGKTMLMDLFCEGLFRRHLRQIYALLVDESLPEKFNNIKRRAHFHAFMEDVHKRKHKLSQAHKANQDVIVPIAREIAREARVLCFDEFQVLDIVDAMILKRLMESLIAYGTVCVITSNRPPDDLYKNGIQRESFIPCIKLLKDRFVVEDLDSGLDYRKMPRALSKVYFHPNTREHQLEFNKLFNGLTSDEEVSQSRNLTVWGRKIKIPESTSKVARFTFAQLCGSPLSASDYMEITKTFATIFVESIPQLTPNERDRARRFILFIDACYESRTKLFCLSDPPIMEVFSDKGPQDPSQISDAMRHAMDDLGLSHEIVSASSIFSNDEEVFAFARAVSRLHEMGTQTWAASTAKHD